MDAATKIQKAKIQLILNQPFFATLALHLKYVESQTTNTAATDGVTVFYNPAYIQQLTIDELTGVIAHEIMHITMLHHTRRGHRDRTRWNHAADYAINPLLLSANFVLPEGTLYNTAFKGKTAEQIYNLLPPADNNAGDQKNKQQDSTTPTPNNNADLSQGSGGTGDVLDLPKGSSVQACEADIKLVVSQARMMAAKQGKLPAFLERLIESLLQPKINWQEVLARFFSELTREDYSWQKPSPRYLYAGLYLPRLESHRMGQLVLIADTSISINQGLLNQFAAEAQEMAAASQMGLIIIYVDSKVQRVEEFDTDEPIHLHPKGGGGTDFRPGFDYIQEQQLQPAAVVYLSDGECLHFPEEPDYPVLWAQFGGDEFDPPFGELVQVD